MIRTLEKALVSSVAVVAVATTGVALSPAAAFAGSDIGWIYTTNGSAKGYFQAYGENVFACDLHADGLRAITFVWWNGDWRGHVEDTDGANGNCIQANLSIAENTDVAIEVCVKNGTYGALQYCSAMVWGKA